MFSVRDPVSGAEPAPLISSTPLAAGQEIYLAVSYDYSDNVARLYSNAVSVVVGTAPIAINTIEDVNNWLGRSQWGDAMFQGKYNEFRIWNGPLMPSEISDHYVAGPDSIEPLPRFTAVYLVPGNPPKIHVEWTGGGTLEVRENLASGVWQDTGYTSPVEVPADKAQMFGRVKK
jgi:hypothetical protein